MGWKPCRLVTSPEQAEAVAENDHSHWRAFKASTLTHSSAHYLNVIDQLHKEKGYVRLTDVAKHLDISKAAASQGIGALKEKGYVVEDEARMLSLGPRGAQLVKVVEHNFMVVSALFNLVLGLDTETARTDACKLEHLLSPDTSLAIACLVKVLLDDPETLQSVREKMDRMLDSFAEADTCPFSENGSREDCPYVGETVGR